MTGRDILNRGYRRMMALVYVGIWLDLVGLVAFALTDREECLYLWVPGVLLLVGTLFVAQVFGLRYPYCRGSLFQLAFQRGGWSLNHKVHFCPYCGEALDDEFPSASEAFEMPPEQ